MVVVGLGGMFIGQFIHSMTIVVQYDLWIEKGMPDQNPLTLLLMTLYVFATISLAFATMTYSRRIKAAESNSQH